MVRVPRPQHISGRGRGRLASAIIARYTIPQNPAAAHPEASKKSSLLNDMMVSPVPLCWLALLAPVTPRVEAVPVAPRVRAVPVAPGFVAQAGGEVGAVTEARRDAPTHDVLAKPFQAISVHRARQKGAADGRSEADAD